MTYEVVKSPSNRPSLGDVVTYRHWDVWLCTAVPQRIIVQYLKTGHGNIPVSVRQI